MKLSLLHLALAAVPLLNSAAAEPVQVDRLVSRHYALEKRDSGFSNGGNSKNAGKGADGKLRNKLNYEISFYHINDVHA
jgi:hypothetical protein